MASPTTPWRKAFNGLFDSPKVYALAKELRVDHIMAYGLVNTLYEFAQPTGGHLSTLFLDCFEQRVRWPGEPGAAVEALYRVGFLDAPQTDGTDVHDYVTMQGSYAEAARKRSRRHGDAATRPARVLSMKPEAIKKRRQRGHGDGDTGRDRRDMSPQCPPEMSPNVPMGECFKSPEIECLGDNRDGDKNVPDMSPLEENRSREDLKEKAAANTEVVRESAEPAPAAASPSWVNEAPHTIQEAPLQAPERARKPVQRVEKARTSVTPVAAVLDHLSPRGRPAPSLPDFGVTKRQGDRPATTLEIRVAAEPVWPGRMGAATAQEVLNGGWSWKDIDWALGQLKERMQKGKSCSPELLVRKLRDDLPLMRQGEAMTKNRTTAGAPYEAVSAFRDQINAMVEPAFRADICKDVGRVVAAGVTAVQAVSLYAVLLEEEQTCDWATVADALEAGRKPPQEARVPKEPECSDNIREMLRRLAS